MTEENLIIYIVRHGEKTEDGQILTERGKKQTKLLAKRLVKMKINNIYSSDFNRCIETAEIIKKKLKLSYKLEKDLREVPSLVKEQPEKYKKEIDKIKKFWKKVTKEKGNILLVSSGIVNRILISFALDIKSNHANFMQYPTGLTKIEKINEKRYRIWHINDSSHLPDKLRVAQSN